jgi:hypothetical protein
MEETKHHLATITINQKKLESPTPTTGRALYELGDVPKGHTLFRETPGGREDVPVPEESPEVHLVQDEKFYSEEGKPHPTEAAIVIDRNRLLSPFETTGEALYVLGRVPDNYTLFREVSGPHEDAPIPKDKTPVRVHEDEKFYSSPGQVTPGAVVHA